MVCPKLFSAFLKHPLCVRSFPNTFIWFLGYPVCVRSFHNMFIGFLGHPTCVVSPPKIFRWFLGYTQFVQVLFKTLSCWFPGQQICVWYLLTSPVWLLGTLFVYCIFLPLSSGFLALCLCMASSMFTIFLGYPIWGGSASNISSWFLGYPVCVVSVPIMFIWLLGYAVCV